MWLDVFKYNPGEPLVGHADKAHSLSAQRDLFAIPISTIDLWQLKEPQSILRKQNINGSWDYPGAKEHIRSKENYNQLETYRNVGILVEMFGFTKQHVAIQKAAEYLFTFQTNEGDFRGIYGNQYTPNYTAGIAELLIKAGYEPDKRIEKVFQWLVSVRQSGGGWALPFRTRNCHINVISTDSPVIKPDLSKPFSQMITGVVLRAFAIHSSYSKLAEAKEAARLLLPGLFEKDNYPDRTRKEYWLRFTFPFWYTDIISALDTLSLLGFSEREPRIEKALEWFVDHQQKNGMWDLRITKGRDKELTRAWLCLAICRIFKRFNDN
ncbi:MAG: hypothetical protein V4717_04120 [Bacteroidota bacterium]